MRTVATTLLAILTGLGVTGIAEHEARAQEIVLTGPLKGAPPVKKMRMYREGRFEIAPAIAFTLLDEYEHSYFFGGRLNYYITDWLAVGVWGGGAVNASTDLTSQVDTVAPRDPLTATNVAPNKPGSGASPTFADQTAKMVWAVFPQITAVPFRGKLALFQALFVDTEAYVFLGAGGVGVNERTPCGDSSVAGQKSCSDASTFALAGGAKFAPTFGIGLTFFLNDIVNIGVEYRALPFSWNRGGFDSRGLGPNGNFPDGKVNGDDATFQFNQVINLSVGIMLGKRKMND